MNCPSCGAQVDADQRFAQLVVCPYCSSAIVLDEKAAKLSGKMAVLPSTPSPFFVGGSGTIAGRRFNILGRVRYGYGRGYWDEWFCQYDDGESAWIGEDERNYTLETCKEVQDLKLDFAVVKPGDQVRIAGVTYQVEEKDIAICEGGEGQLPFRILMDEKTPFLHLVAEDTFATLEYDLDDADRLFRGQRLELSDIKMDFTAEEVGQTGGGVVDRTGDDQRRERVVKSDKRSADIKCFSCASPLPVPEAGAKSVTCASCGSTLDLTLRQVECPGCQVTVPLTGGERSLGAVCPHCRGVLDISGEQPQMLAQLTSKKRPKLPFKLGQACRFDDQDYHVVGHIRFQERDAWGVYRSDEFMLFNKTAGFRWLVMENGHFSISDRLDHGPMMNPRGAVRKKEFRFLERKWQVFEHGEPEVRWVDGELPWVCALGDKNRYMDAICPPYMLSAEWTETELEWYEARYLEPHEVGAAFQVDADSLPPREGVAPHQPYDPSRFKTHALVVCSLFTLLFGMLLLAAMAVRGSEIGRFEVSPQNYAQEYISPAFQVSKRNAMVKAKFYADVSNSWTYLDLAVIDAQEQVLMDFSAQMSYYSGSSGGESWSEGSRSDSKVFKIHEPGEYRLLILGQGGSGNEPVTGGGRTVRITLHEGAQLLRYYVLGAIVSLVGCIGFAIDRGSFSQKRWGDEDDDDDD